MSGQEQAQEERSDAQFALECIAFGFVLGVAYCTTVELLRLRNEVRFVRRVNRFRRAWHDSRLDESPAAHEEKADDAS